VTAEIHLSVRTSKSWLFFEAYGNQTERRSVLSLMGFVRVRPSIDILMLRQLQASEDALGPSLLRDRSRSALVVSHHLDGFLRNRAAGLLRPAADHGVRSVSLRGLPTADRSRWRATAASPLRTTLRRIPLVDSRTASPRPLPSWRYHLPSASPEGSTRADRSQLLTSAEAIASAHGRRSVRKPPTRPKPCQRRQRPKPLPGDPLCASPANRTALT
jgi:hypothetical protein